MKSVEDLDVFKLAHQLALKTYSTTKTFPREETFSLVDQMRRAAASVGMNLMEGAMRLGSREYRQFVGIARGSAGEVCYQLLLAKDLNYITTTLTGNCDRDTTEYSRCFPGFPRPSAMHRALGSCPITSTVVLRSTNTCFLPTRSRGTNTAVCPSCQSNVAKCQDNGCEKDLFSFITGQN